MSDLSAAERRRLLAEFAATWASLPSERSQAWRLGEALRRILRADGVAITVDYLSEGRATLYASDEASYVLEALQELAAEGPGFSAARSNSIVVADFDGESHRWPML